MPKILIVDDEAKIRTILKIILGSAGHQLLEAENGRDALSLLENEGADLVISDIRMEGMTGLEMLTAVREKELGCPVVFITAFATFESAVEALRLGAVDYLVKPFEEKDVLLAVERALGMRRVLAENVRLRQEFAGKKEVDGVFLSPPMQKVKTLAEKVAAADATVLLTGESGTGKEVVARHIHRVRHKKAERFVALNCAAIPPNLLEAELFGHERGAFTGAEKARAGKFEFAAAGTLFLDEIGEMPLDAQVKLLRAIQEKSIQRVGGNQDIPISCRLVCATNRDLLKRVREGAFREDLYYRLAVFPIHIPPLRERREDIAPLVGHCVERLGRRSEGEILTDAARRLLEEYPWPGNVRELFNAVERALILKEGDLPLNNDDFSGIKTVPAPRAAAGELFRLPPEGVDYEELQRSIVRQALHLTQGNQSSAARLLQVSRTRFRTLLGLLEDTKKEGTRYIFLRRNPKE